MKSILTSIQPKWCELIASGIKTVEVRKSKPKLETPFKVYIYCTKGYVAPHSFLFAHNCQSKVIGEFVCDEIIKVGNYQEVDYSYMLWVKDRETTDKFCKNACLDEFAIQNYLGAKGGYGWHISNLVIYDKPKDLDYFRKPIDCHRGKDRENCKGCWDCEIKRPPQSWCYVESEVDI